MLHIVVFNFIFLRRRYSGGIGYGGACGCGPWHWFATAAQQQPIGTPAKRQPHWSFTEGLCTPAKQQQQYFRSSMPCSCSSTSNSNTSNSRAELCHPLRSSIHFLNKFMGTSASRCSSCNSTAMSAASTSNSSSSSNSSKSELASQPHAAGVSAA